MCVLLFNNLKDVEDCMVFMSLLNVLHSLLESKASRYIEGVLGIFRYYNMTMSITLCMIG